MGISAFHLVKTLIHTAFSSIEIAITAYSPIFQLLMNPSMACPCTFQPFSTNGIKLAYIYYKKQNLSNVKIKDDVRILNLPGEP